MEMRRNVSDFIAISGIADWAIKFKTGCRSEYVVIDIAQKQCDYRRKLKIRRLENVCARKERKKI